MNDRFPHVAWPDIPRVCFGPGSPAFLNACVDWVLSSPRDLTGYTEGYHRAAAALYAFADERGSSPDYLVFPIAFLWRHHVELALKDIIAIGRELGGEPWGFPPGHKLGELWRTARPYITRCGDTSAPELAIVEANISELETIDPGADGFRYPLGRDQTTRSMPRSPKLVNLRVLHEAMEAMASFLSAVRCELGVRLDYVREAEAEAELRRTVGP